MERWVGAEAAPWAPAQIVGAPEIRTGSRWLQREKIAYFQKLPLGKPRSPRFFSDLDTCSFNLNTWLTTSWQQRYQQARDPPLQRASGPMENRHTKDLQGDAPSNPMCVCSSFIHSSIHCTNVHRGSTIHKIRSRRGRWQLSCSHLHSSSCFTSQFPYLSDGENGV